MIIYKTTNLLNQKIYVGKDCNCNPNYLGSGTWILRAIKKYGKENFKKETLEICDASNIFKREKYWIKKLDARNPKIGYNLAVGGLGSSGWKHSKEALRKIQKASAGKNNPRYGIHLSDELKKKISDSEKGKIITEAHRKAISSKLTGHPGYWLGKKQSKAHKRNIGNASKKIWSLPGMRDKIIAAQKLGRQLRKAA